MYQQPAKDNRASGKNDDDNLLLDSFTPQQAQVSELGATLSFGDFTLKIKTLTDECIHTAGFLVRRFGLYSPNH